jgi:hypothetical protein
MAQLGELASLEQQEVESAIDKLTRAAESMPSEHRHILLTRLCGELTQRFANFMHSCRSDIDNAVSILRDTESMMKEAATHSNSCLSATLDALGVALLTRFQRLGDCLDYDASVVAHRRASSLCSLSDVNFSRRHHNFATALRVRAERCADLSGFNEALSVQQKVFPSAQPMLLQSGLGKIYYSRFMVGFDGFDLENSIKALKHASLFPNQLPDIYGSLGNAHLERYRQTQATRPTDDLKPACYYLDLAVKQTPIDHPERPLRLVDLSRLKYELYLRTPLSGLPYLQEAVTLTEMAASKTPKVHPDYSQFLWLHATFLHKLFQVQGERQHLEKSFELIRESLGLTLDEHPKMPYMLVSLANFYRTRFKLSHDPEDLRSAIVWFQVACVLTPKASPYYQDIISNLATAFHQLYSLMRHSSDLYNAVSLHCEVLQFVPAGHPRHVQFSLRLGDAYHQKYLLDKTPEDLDKAMELQMNAMNRSKHRTDHSQALGSLGSSHLSRFRRDGKKVDLENAVKFFRECSEQTPQDQPDWVNAHRYLGDALVVCYRATRRPEDLQSAIDAYSRPARSSGSPPTVLFDIVLKWAQTAHTHAHKSALEAYSIALELLARLAWVGVDVKGRHRILASRAGNLASDAAVCAIAAGKLEKAVEWVDSGRSVLFGQALQLRTSFDDLRMLEPDLADDLRSTARELDGASSQVLESGPDEVIERDSARRRKLGERWDSLVATVRAMDNFHDFLRPRTIDQLRPAASRGPVVLLIASTLRCDAIIIKYPSAPVELIHLPKMTYDDAVGMAIELTKVLKSLNLRQRLARREHLPGNEPGDKIRQILAKLWSTVMEPVMSAVTLVSLPRKFGVMVVYVDVCA